MTTDLVSLTPRPRREREPASLDLFLAVVIHALRLAYLGAPFAGWQRQANALAVQEVVEAALAAHLGSPVSTVGASRTDAGVHARGQVASFRWPGDLEPGGLVHGVGARLPPSVRVLAAGPAPDGFHARRSAAAKTYCYRCRPGRFAPPERAPWVLPVRSDLDHAAIAAATALLPGRHDFAAFALAGRVAGPTDREIFGAAWERRGTEWWLRITGEGFLRGMVRALAGTLLEVGAGRLAISAFRALLDGRPRAAGGPTAPAHGLTLERVDYPAGLAPLW